MKFKEQAFRIASFSGALLLLAPIIFMFVLPVFLWVNSQIFMIDYLIPLEVFPVVFLGAAILSLVACKTGLLKKRICLLSVLLIVMFVSGQYIAMISGLADGTAPASGLPFIAVISTVIIYDVITLVLGIYGLSLYMKLKNMLTT